MSVERPVLFDEDNPEWTVEDFARARPIEDFPELAVALARARGRQKAPTKRQVTVRLDGDVIDRLKAAGPGWQSRLNATLRKAVGL